MVRFKLYTTHGDFVVDADTVINKDGWVVFVRRERVTMGREREVKSGIWPFVTRRTVTETYEVNNDTPLQAISAKEIWRVEYPAQDAVARHQETVA